MSNYRNNDVERFAEMFGALSNPNRLSIFLRLLSCCAPGSVCETEADLQKCAGEIGQGLGIAPSTVSHHLKELRQAGLIRVERRGQKAECSVDLDTLQDLIDFFAHRVEQ